MKNNVEKFRIEKKLSQEEFANFINVSRQTVSSIENQRYNPSLVLAFKISHFFGIPIEDIFLME